MGLYASSSGAGIGELSKLFAIIQQGEKAADVGDVGPLAACQDETLLLDHNHVLRAAF